MKLHYICQVSRRIGPCNITILNHSISQYCMIQPFNTDQCNYGTRLSIIFSTNNRSFLPVCFPSSLESTPGSPPSTTH